MSAVQDVAAFVGVVLGIGMIFLATRSLTRSKGKNIINHVIYAALVLLVVFGLSVDAKEVIFTPLSVIMVGTVYPIYESLRAVCTIEETDDTTWLSYWIAQGIISFSTEWVDGLGNSVSLTWNVFEFFFYLWLILPQTDGAALIFDAFLGPIIAPLVQPLVTRADGFINKIVNLLTNATHLGFVWIVFVFLPSDLKRAIWIILGTIYPLGSSIISVTTPEPADDTFWLTYWSCFGALFLIVDFLENFLGFVPGFYSLAIFATVYLMLPLFRGAEVVFRTVLVPLAGLQELLVKKDADAVKLSILADVPPERRQLLMKEIADSFVKGADELPKTPTGYNAIV
mmetsp:Transcript_9042/g.9924  ORF Transcript_9042/g.9924 Transcript_9042/m.9924 type:complete len:341 (+) Transcript_9042:83-1105(+)